MGDSGFVRRCHDGVDVYSTTHSQAALLEIASAVTRFKLTVKPYAPWQPLALTLFPQRALGHDVVGADFRLLASVDQGT